MSPEASATVKNKIHVNNLWWWTTKVRPVECFGILAREDGLSVFDGQREAVQSVYEAPRSASLGRNHGGSTSCFPASVLE